jgi:hypothetical protein
MRRTWTITLLEHEQPNAAAWRAACRFADDWNARQSPKFAAEVPFLRTVLLDSGDQPSLERLLAELRALGDAAGTTYRLNSRNVLEEADYSRADFIGILGVGLGDDSRPLILNAAAALAPSRPCPQCGWHDAFDQVQREPLVLNEALLDQKNADDEPPPHRGGWDLVELPGGQKLASPALLAVLKAGDVRGCEQREVLTAAGRASRRMTQITATKAILTPCDEHSRVDGAPFCPACGTAQGSLKDYFWVRQDWLGEDEVISRHPGRGAMLYVSRRVYALLRSAGLGGILRHDVLFVCRHAPLHAAGLP